MRDDRLSDANELIRADCDRTLDELEAKCCDPGRSPRMTELRTVFAEIEDRLASFRGGPESADVIVGVLEQAGAQIGSLQVSCCAPGRMPLYDTMLHNLMKAQRAVRRETKSGD